MRATVELLPMQPGDVVATAADTTRLERAVGFKPSTPLAVGVQRFVDWYREHYGVGTAPRAAS
jgi:UDP-glucuronate 4-epimerase